MTIEIYSTLNQLLAKGENVILARIIRRSGSAPRDVGSMCLVTKDDLLGTVGGGSIEYQMEKAARRLLERGESSIYPFRMHNEDVAESGMICGGDVDLFLEPVFPDNETKRTVYQAVAECIEHQSPGILMTRVADRIPADGEDANLFVMPDQAAVGAIKGLASQDVTYERLDGAYPDPYALAPSAGTAPDLFVERIGEGHRVVLFGAGHVSVCVAAVAHMVGFDVTVIDDRAEFANKERFPQADSLMVNGFDTVFDQLNITPSSYVVILTRGHLHDAVVLEKALATNAGYIGMIGSKRKRNLIYRDLLEKGFEKTALEKVFCPVGVSINAQTPEEIAVSIVAELIAKRAPEKKVRLA